MMVKRENQGSGVGQIKKPENPGSDAGQVQPIQSRRSAIASYRSKPTPEYAVEEITREEFDKLEAAEDFVWRLNFPVRVSGGSSADGDQKKWVLSAQLKGGKRFEAQVYRPKGSDGKLVELVKSGDYGIPTLRASENIIINKDSTGKHTFVVIPTLIAWEPVPEYFIQAHMGPNGKVIWDAPADAPKVQPKKNLGLG